MLNIQRLTFWLFSLIRGAYPTTTSFIAHSNQRIEILCFFSREFETVVSFSIFFVPFTFICPGFFLFSFHFIYFHYDFVAFFFVPFLSLSISPFSFSMPLSLSVSVSLNIYIYIYIYIPTISNIFSLFTIMSHFLFSLYLCWTFYR